MKYTKEQVSQAMENLPTLWIVKHQIKNEAGLPIEFDRHRFMYDLYNDLSPLQVTLKPPQIGATVKDIIKSFWVSKKMHKDIIYTLPTATDVNDMAGGKINRLVAQNPILKEWIKDKDTVDQKSVGDNIIYYRGCIDLDTEVLTEKGWSKYEKVAIGDRLPTLNIETNTIELDKVLDITSFDLPEDEHMVHIKSRQIDQMVTQDHRCITSKRKFNGEKGALRVERAHELVGKTTSYIPVKHNPVTDKGIGNPSLYRILGWVIGDGSYWTKRDKYTTKNGDNKVALSYKVCIIQSKFCDVLEKHLSEANIGFYKKPHNKTCFRYELNSKASELIRDLLPEKELTFELVFNSTQSERVALYEGLMMSDGDNDLHSKFYQNKGNTVDAFQALMVFLGKTTSQSISKKCVTISIKQSEFAHVKAVLNDVRGGTAWCPTTSNGTIFIRRNGIVSVTGQTFSNKQAMMVSSDLNIHDEVDASDSSVITQYETRLQAKSGGWRWYFSHPSLAGHGVDVYWQQSDKKEWFIQCSHCKHEQYLQYPHNIDEDNERYICSLCKEELSDESRSKGEWRATAEGEFSGYHISQMMCTWITAKDILKAKNDPMKDEQYFYNYVLGLPYVASENKISSEVVLRNVNNRSVNTQDGTIVIGVDTGLPIHYSIGNKQGMFYFGKCKAPSATYDPYDELESLLIRFPKSIMVADQGGDLIGIRRLQDKYPGRVFLCYYRRDRKSNEIIKWGRKGDDGIVTVDRNRMIQLLVEHLRKPGYIPLMNGTSEEWREFAQSFDSIYRTVKETPFGNEYIWERNGPDHFVHTMVYVYVGLDKYSDVEAKVVGHDIFKGMETGRFFLE